MKCPWSECGYVRQESDTAPEWQCPACNNAYNKHPDYSGNNYYQIILTYSEVPEDKQIQTGKLYLYLKANNLEGCCIDKSGKIERIQLSSEDLKCYQEIVAALSTPSALLSLEQETAIFLATAKKAQSANSLQEFENTSSPLSLKNLVLVVIGVLLLLVIIFKYFSSNTQNTDVERFSVNSFINSPDYKSPKSTINLYTFGINLDFISSKLQLADSQVKQCKEFCQKSRERDTSCDQVIEILNEVSPQTNKLKQYLKTNSIDKLPSHDQEQINQINQYLWSIPQDMDSANDLCSQNIPKANSTPTMSYTPAKADTNTLDFAQQGIHLNIIYSKLFTADANVRNCRVSCEVNRNLSKDCTMFVGVYNDTKPQLEQLFELVRDNSGRISNEDDQYIKKIIYLLDDIESERKKAATCLRSL